MSADATFWNGVAAGYAAKPVDDPDAFERKIAITRALMPPDATVVDVGCGTGSLALILAPDAGHVHGVDFSSEMLAFAREKAADTPNVSFHQGTLDQAPLQPESLDVVMAWSLLHLVPDRADLLARLFDLARPGGALVTSTVCLGRSWVPYWAILPVMRLFGKAPRVWMLTPERIRDEVQAAGFVDVQIHDVGSTEPVCFLTARKPER